MESVSSHVCTIHYSFLWQSLSALLPGFLSMLQVSKTEKKTMRLLSQIIPQIQRHCWSQQGEWHPWSAGSLGKLLLYCAKSFSLDIFMHLILDWAVTGDFWGWNFLCIYQLIYHANSFPLCFIVIALSAFPTEVAGRWKYLQCFFCLLQGLDKFRKHSLLPTTSMDQGSKGWLCFGLATLLVVGALWLFWAHGTEWIHWVTGL